MCLEMQSERCCPSCCTEHPVAAVWAQLSRAMSLSSVPSRSCCSAMPWTCSQSHSTWEEQRGAPRLGGQASLPAGPLHCPPALQHQLWRVLSIIRPCQGPCSIGSCGCGYLSPLKQADKGNGARSSSKLWRVWAKELFYVQTNTSSGREKTSSFLRQLEVPNEDHGIYILSGAKSFRDKYY